MENKHTPVPWEVIAGVRRHYIRRDWSSGEYVAQIDVPTGDDAEEALANARLIVRAVNNHEGLLAALEACHTVICEMDIDNLIPVDYALAATTAGNAAYAAIAQAKEGE